MSKPLPEFKKSGDKSVFLVDGQPFLILGLQWDCDSCFTPHDMSPLFPHAARMGANTATLPTPWRSIEPEPDRYDFSIIDEAIRCARENNMRIIPLWFGTWKNACSFYAPDYIRENPATYQPALSRNGDSCISLCYNSDITWQRDRKALCELMKHIREVDQERTVIMVQVENEAGLLGTDRCYCPTCNERFAAGTWVEIPGVSPEEAFSTVCLAQYIDRLAGEAKAVYNLPMYVNVWLANPVGSIAGRDYPCGGAVPMTFDLYRQQLHHIDLIAPDIYKAGFREFQWFSQVYCVPGNPYYVAEHSSSMVGRAERNVFYAIGQYGAVGFDPWAIDSPFPEREGHPLIDPVGGEWGLQAYWLRDSYVSIQRAIQPIVAAQGTPRLFTFVQDFPAENGTAWTDDGVDVIIGYRDRDHAARGMVIRLSQNEFLALGVGFQVQFRRPRPSGQPVPLKKAEWGEYKGDKWVLHHPMRRERPESVGWPIVFLEPGVAKITLDI